jgi:hypothetical protein
METANTMFGYDGWGYTVTSLEHTAGIWKALVLTTVNAGGDPVVREDVGVGIPAQGKDRTTGELFPITPAAQETAIKGAVTDALKRALRGYGDQFGLSLYDKDGDDVKAPAPAMPRPAQPPAQPPQPPATKAPPIGPERAAKLEGLVQKALTDQGATQAYALNWLDAAQRRLQRTHMSDLTVAEGEALLKRARETDVTMAPDAASPNGSWEATDSPARGPDPEQGQAKACQNCDQPMIFLAGVKDGKEWKAWFCSAKCGAKPLWVK